MRAAWKGAFAQNLILKKINDWKKRKFPLYKAIKIFSRNVTIFPTFVGLRFDIHSGKKFLPLLIKQEMVGFKFGEFVLTRKIAKHNQKN